MNLKEYLAANNATLHTDASEQVILQVFCGDKELVCVVSDDVDQAFEELHRKLGLELDPAVVARLKPTL